MASSVIPDERVKHLNNNDIKEGEYVLYWMQQAQRGKDNHALEYAVQQANALGQPLLVAFGLMDDYPEANARHYAFMLEGLQDVAVALERRGVKFVLRRGPPDKVALDLAKDAALVVCDRGYLRHQRAWRERVAKGAGCRVTQVESDVVVPVEVVSNKAEHAARTIRPKIHKHWERFLVGLRPTSLAKDSRALQVDGMDLGNLEAVLDDLKLDRSVPPVAMFKGGTGAAKGVLTDFLEHRFSNYSQNRNQPQTSDVSHMSKYLHFGHISPITVALEIRASGAGAENVEGYIEELIVRRELPMNFVTYTPDYDQYSCIPDWAKKTLREHKDDKREPLYSREQLDEAKTHDPYWNAAMNEMRYTGYMHNYMRMYWGKKILEWSKTPEEAFATTLALNNRYFLDGRDANSFANVAWLFGQHDRAWTERAVYGKVRYMSAGGLERKAKPQHYINKVERLMEEVGAA